MLHTNLHLHVALAGRKKCAKPWNYLKSNAVSEIGEHWIEKRFFFISLFILTHSSAELGVERNHTATAAEGLHTLTRDNFAFVPHVIFIDAASVFSYRQNPYKMQLICYQTTRQ